MRRGVVVFSHFFVVGCIKGKLLLRKVAEANQFDMVNSVSICWNNSLKSTLFPSYFKIYLRSDHKLELLWYDRRFKSTMKCILWEFWLVLVKRHQGIFPPLGKVDAQPQPWQKMDFWLITMSILNGNAYFTNSNAARHFLRQWKCWKQGLKSKQFSRISFHLVHWIFESRVNVNSKEQIVGHFQFATYNARGFWNARYVFR